MHTLPRGFLDVKIDGRETFFEWLSAGRYTCQNERGTMAMVTHGPIKDVYFGFSDVALLIRIDFDRPAQTALADFDSLRIGFVEPRDLELRIDKPATPDQRVSLNSQGGPLPTAACAVGLDRIVEVAIPFDAAGCGSGSAHPVLRRCIGRPAKPRPRAAEGMILLTRPSPDFEQIMWDV